MSLVILHCNLKHNTIHTVLKRVKANTNRHHPSVAKDAQRPAPILCMHQWFWVQSARCAAVAHSGRVTLCNYPSPILHANLVSHRWCGVTLHRFMVGFSSRKSALDMTATAGRQYITLPVRTQWACLNELLQTDRTDGLCLGMCHGII